MYDVAIVGGGLSGLLVALEVHHTDKTWILLEASSRLGGRLENDTSGNQIDLGGAWIWPKHQPHIKQLMTTLGIETFLQPDDPSSTRVVGGAVRIVTSISDQLPNQHIRTDSPVACCKRIVLPSIGDTCSATDACITSHFVSLSLASGEEVEAKRVVMAAPPKLVSTHVDFHPALHSAKERAMSQSQTWMAGVTKVSLVYNSPRFWPLHESNVGFRPRPDNPAFQVYDSSPKDEHLSALTFFTLASISDAGTTNDEALAKACAAQMAGSSTVGQSLLRYDDYHVKRWPQEKYISEDDMPSGINPHPAPDVALSKIAWDGMLFFAGSEADLSSPGLMEGAVGAARRVVNELKSMWNKE